MSLRADRVPHASGSGTWDPSEKEIPLAPWQDQFEWVEEFQASPDGESVAAIVKAGEGEFNVCVNGRTWPESFDKMWYLRYSPDGRLAVALARDGTMTLFPTEGGAPRPVPGAAPEDVPMRWTPDGHALYVQSGSGVPARVELLDVETGERRPWRELTPPDPAGIRSIGPVRVSRDGRSHVYSYRRILDQLNVVEGVRCSP